MILVYRTHSLLLSPFENMDQTGTICLGAPDFEAQSDPVQISRLSVSFSP